MGHLRKITAHVPERLLAQAQAATGEGVTETVRRGLAMLAAARASQRLLRLRGKMKIDLDLRELRRDRR